MRDATLGVLVEDMDAAGVKGDLDGVAGAGSGAGGNAGDQVGLADRQIQVNLGAHQLGHVHISINGAVRQNLDLCGLVMDALRTQTDDDLTVNILLQRGIVCSLMDLSSKLKYISSPFLVSVPLMKFIWGVPMKPATNRLQGLSYRF